MTKLNVASFFSGAGGLDLGFKKAGFDFEFANDNWKGCWKTYETNHNMEINKKSIEHIDGSEFGDVAGFVGGPPCQSWSLAGAMKGIKDPRGRLLYDYLRLIKIKKPLFFLTENVPGMVSKTHIGEFNKFITELEKIGYNVSYKILNAHDYCVAQDRKRVFIIGFRSDFECKFEFPKPLKNKIFLKDAIGDLPDAVKAGNATEIPNHEYMTGDFSSMYMSRNRVRSWDEPSFTIQASGRHAPLHPQANKMIRLEADRWMFDSDSAGEYRRLSVRECARIQSFPDDFVFEYKNINDGYKMVGNAVPVNLAYHIALQIKSCIK